MRLVARSHLRQPMVEGVSKPLGQSRPFPRLFSFLSANTDNSSAGSCFLRMFSPFFQTVFPLPDDKLLLQILAFALIRGICRMSPVPTCSAALQRCQRCFSRMLRAHRADSQAGSSQADRHLLSGLLPSKSKHPTEVKLPSELTELIADQLVNVLTSLT